jgi:hypothetical protein
MMAARAMKLKLKLKNNPDWEVSMRRQVGDADSMLNTPGWRAEHKEGRPWWKDVGMEEGM